MTADDAKPPSPERRPRWRRWAIEATIFLAVVAGFQAWQLRDAARGPAPEISGRLVDGSPFDLAQWRAQYPGKPVLLYFWAEWCPVCKTTAGSVTAVAEDWPVTTVAMQSGSAAEIAAQMAARGYRWSTVADPQGELTRRFGFAGVPAFAVIDPGGEIRFVAIGWTSETALRLRLWWAGRAAS
jgi:thiol-disulfide isomerase/thioredoxin